MTRLRIGAHEVARARSSVAGDSNEDQARRTRIFLLITAVFIAVPVAENLMLAERAGITRTDLQRHDLGVTGREVVQVRVALAPGAAFGRHTHPGEEMIYMLEGTLEYEVEGRPAPVKLKAGDVLFIPARAVHAAKNPGRSKGAELATYVVEKGKPLLTMVR